MKIMRVKDLTMEYNNIVRNYFFTFKIVHLIHILCILVNSIPCKVFLHLLKFTISAFNIQLPSFLTIWTLK